MEIGWQLYVFALILAVGSVSAAGKCKVCDSTEPKCQKEPSTIPATTDCDADKCFTLVESNGNIKRGCVSTTAEKYEGKNCQTCDAVAEPCNVKTDLFWCKTCESSASADCSYWKNENAIPNELCPSGVTKCLMEIKTDKHISRRCVTKNDEACSSDKKCSICSETSCNKGVFPSDRRKCYQCNSEDPKCASPTKNPADILSYSCLLYDESEKCFEHGSSDTSMSRGCLSDTTAYAKCSSETPTEKCKQCTSDGCNVDEYKLDSTVKCIQCTSDDAKCATSYSANDAKTCSNKIEYWKTQGCYTNKIEAGKVSRGCIQDFDCAAASTTCTSCTSGDACNNSLQKSCYKCRSTDDANCEGELNKDKIKPQVCRNQVTTDAADAPQCYVELWNGIVIRSCLDDADKKTKANCLDEKYKQCVTCKGDNCNTGKQPNSAHSMALASGLLVLSLLTLKFF